MLMKNPIKKYFTASNLERVIPWAFAIYLHLSPLTMPEPKLKKPAMKKRVRFVLARVERRMLISSCKRIRMKSTIPIIAK